MRKSRWSSPRGPCARRSPPRSRCPSSSSRCIFEGRVLIDGGLVNPLPFDILNGEADLTVAIDVSGAPVRRPGPGDAQGVGGALCLQLHLRAHDHQGEAALAPSRRLHRRRHQPLSDPRLPEARRDPRRRRAGQGAAEGATGARARSRDHRDGGGDRGARAGAQGARRAEASRRAAQRAARRPAADERSRESAALRAQPLALLLEERLESAAARASSIPA